jgi:hypothetical protein
MQITGAGETEAGAREQESDACPPSLTGGGLPELTETAFACLKSAGPWMKFLGIVTFAVCGIMLIAGLVMAFSVESMLGRLTGLTHITLAVVCFFPARFLFLAGARLGALGKGGGACDLEAALRNNKAYWKFSGLFTIVSLLFVLLLVIILFATKAFG